MRAAKKQQKKQQYNNQGYAVAIDGIAPDPKRFPEFNSTDPGQRLHDFNAAVRARGWRGLGLWNRMHCEKVPPQL